MTRSKPFSGKQKKDQLKAKKERKRVEDTIERDSNHTLSLHEKRKLAKDLINNKNSKLKHKVNKDDEEEEIEEYEEDEDNGLGHSVNSDYEDDDEEEEEVLDKKNKNSTTTTTTTTTTNNRNKEIINEISNKMMKFDIGDKNTSRNKLVTIFEKESRDEIEYRKEQSKLPINMTLRDQPWLIMQGYGSDEFIDIPKRPQWETGMSGDRLKERERKMFIKWLEDITDKYDKSRLNYFEHNLEVWRQLWRVSERSDIIFLVTDARYPLFHFPPALYNYIQKDLKKPMMIILNKVDLVDKRIVKVWINYFTETYPGIKVVCFSSFKPITEETEQLDISKKRKFKKGRKRYETAEGKQLLIKSILSFNIEKNDNMITVGMVGHPNVGKSSLINGLMGKKVVSTSRTPGHTKHFQTIILTKNIQLCDCPGLVFPALDRPKPLQILCGLFPIAQVREPYSAIRYLSERVPLEKVYGLTNPYEGEPWSPLSICEAFALKRGYLIAKSGRPDPHRAGLEILRDCVDGNIVISWPPPTFTKEDYLELNLHNTHKPKPGNFIPVHDQNQNYPFIQPPVLQNNTIPITSSPMTMYPFPCYVPTPCHIQQSPPSVFDNSQNQTFVQNNFVHSQSNNIYSPQDNNNYLTNYSQTSSFPQRRVLSINENQNLGSPGYPFHIFGQIHPTVNTNFNFNSNQVFNHSSPPNYYNPSNVLPTYSFQPYLQINSNYYNQNQYNPNNQQFYFHNQTVSLPNIEPIEVIDDNQTPSPVAKKIIAPPGYSFYEDIEKKWDEEGILPKDGKLQRSFTAPELVTPKKRESPSKPRGGTKKSNRKSLPPSS
eukprot:gene5408-6745_t